jgi:predicted ATPase
VKKYGKDSASPFELDIILEDKPLNISNVGYGVSQSLPILIELFARIKGSWFAIQQPEVHLHPRAQATLGDVFYFIAEKENKKLLIETHSDFIIDRFRANFKKNSSTIDAQVLFFERVNGVNKVHSIRIHKNGMYDENQPESFRSFFIKEELDILGIR